MSLQGVVKLGTSDVGMIGAHLAGALPGLARGVDRAVGGLAAGWALGATAVLALADLALTIDVATTHGLLEANPLARTLAAYAGAEGLVVWKLFTLTLGVWVLARYRHRRLARAAAIVALVAHCWMMGQWSHYLDAMRVSHEGSVSLAGHDLAMNL